MRMKRKIILEFFNEHDSKWFNLEKLVKLITTKEHVPKGTKMFLLDVTDIDSLQSRSVGRH